jgi:hypothetical protein
MRARGARRAGLAWQHTARTLEPSDGPDRTSVSAGAWLVRWVVCGLVALLAISPAAVAQDRAVVPVAFDPPMVDFGYVTPGTRYQAEVRVTNTSSQTITPLRLSSSCSCTSASLSKTTLAPGESATMTITLTASYAMIDKTTQIRVSGDPQRFPAPAELPVRSYPQMGLVGTPSMITGTPDGGAPITGQLTVESVDGKPFRVRSVNLQPYTTPHEAAARQTVPYHMDGPTKRHWLVVETTHPTCPFLVVPVGDGPLRREAVAFARAESIQLADRREITLGYVEPGQTVEVLVPVFRSADTLNKPVSIVGSPAGTRAEIVGWTNQLHSHGPRQAPVYQIDARVRLTITGNPGQPFMGALGMQAEGDRSVLTLHVIGRIVEPGAGTPRSTDGQSPPPGLLRPEE